MNLLRSLLTVSGMTMISRVLGFVRDAVIARSFGAGLYTDAFFVAFKLPNLLRRVFAEGAFSQAFVPILAEYKSRRGEQDTRVFVEHITALLALALFLVTAVGILAAPVIVYVSAPGFAAVPEKFDVTVQLLRVTFPYILFISLASLAGAILNTYSRFAIPAFTPTLLNLSFIVFALWLAPWFDPPVMALAWAVFLGGLLQLGFQLPYLLRIGLLPRPRLNLRDPGVWRVLKLMGPAIFGVSIGQISLLINGIFASFLVTGSVSWLYYADRLMEFPTGVLGVALGTILLPSLSRSFADKSTEAYSRLLDWGLRLTLLLALPAAVALAILAVPLIATLFHHGAFDGDDVTMTSRALVAYSIGLVGLILVKVLAPGFYARQDIKTPVKIGVLTLIATQLMNAAFVYPLQHAGLALAIGLGACLNAGLLYRKLRQHGVFTPQPGWGRFAAQTTAALAVMGVALWLAMGPPEVWLAGSVWQRALRLTLVVLVGAASYFAALWLAGVRPRDFVKRVN
ncbi:MAG TPA: murein biosynthesis integral membrane protein MurJ [Burkholderiales bacterium]|nr:murein biosynthesis integral membrane protein MurJ [Burkholderiales bacterium]